MRRGEVYWATFPAPVGRRPVLVLTPTRALRYLTSVTVARVTTHRRGTPAEVDLGASEGLSRPSVANLFNIETPEQCDLDPEPVGRLPGARMEELNDALRFALGILD